MQNTSLLRSTVADVFTTSDGSALNTDCAVAYGSEAEKKSNDMMSTISSTIADSECAGKVNTVSSGRGFSANGNEVDKLNTFHVTSTYLYKGN